MSIFSGNLKTYPRLHLDITVQDLMAGLGFCLSRCKREEYLTKIRDYWQQKVLVMLSVRTAFDVLLQCLNLPSGSQVLISGVNIENMFAIVEAHSLISVGVDLDVGTLRPNLEAFKAAITPQTRLCVIAHLFGSIVPLDAYLEVCQEHQIVLVEDCAQAFAGKDYLGHPEADVSLFSFGPIKSATALGGAVVRVREARLRLKMQELEAKYGSKSRVWYGKRLLKYGGLKLLSQPWLYNQLLLILKQMRVDCDRVIGNLARGFANGDLLPKLRYRPPTPMLALLSRRLQAESSYQHRIETAQQFLSWLDAAIEIPGKDSAFHSFWLVAIATNNPAQGMLWLRENGFDATQGATSLRSRQDCPTATDLLSRILYLPVSPVVPESELLRLAQLVNQFNHKNHE
jgi:perosamine synthetase